ncbi:MAG: hypothetical protein ACRYF3_10050 [Janthinobacterium lividum]
MGASTASGNTTAFDGKPGNTMFYLQFRLNAPSTYVFTTAYWGGRDYIFPRFTTP